jgi:hypothetical protein
MKRTTFLCIAFSMVTLFIVGLSPLHSNSEIVQVISISVTENTSNGGIVVPEHFVLETNESIDGIIDRTVPFEVVPGGDISFELHLWNEGDEPVTSEILLQLVFPNDVARDMYSHDLTLEGKESLTLTHETTIPEILDIYGRYQFNLIIDDRLADFFMFDLHSRSQIEVRWDDGVMANAWAFTELCNAWAIRGCLPDGAILDSVGVYILSEGDLYWPWPDDIHQDILVQVFDNDGAGGMPGTLLWSEVTRVTPGTSHAVAYPNIPISSAFYIANDQLTNYPECEGQGVDERVDHPDQMFTRIDNVWENAGSDYGGDFMIWGVGHVGAAPFWFGNPPAD